MIRQAFIGKVGVKTAFSFWGWRNPTAELCVSLGQGVGIDTHMQLFLGMQNCLLQIHHYSDSIQFVRR